MPGTKLFDKVVENVEGVRAADVADGEQVRPGGLADLGHLYRSGHCSVLSVWWIHRVMRSRRTSDMATPLRWHSARNVARSSGFARNVSVEVLG